MAIRGLMNCLGEEAHNEVFRVVMPHLGKPDTGALASEIVASVRNIDHIEKLPMLALKILLNGERK